MKQAELFHPRVFDDQEWAEGYYTRNVKNIERQGARIAQLLQTVGFKEGRILDAGCGFASVAIELARNFPDADITGIDLGEPLLKLGQNLVDQAGVSGRITLLKGDVQQLEYETDSFDVVVNTFMVHVVEDPVSMLNEIERVTKPHGRILITDLRRNWIAWFAKKFRTALTVEEAMEIIDKSDLRPATCSKGFYWWDYMVGI